MTDLTQVTGSSPSWQPYMQVAKVVVQTGVQAWNAAPPPTKIAIGAAILAAAIESGPLLLLAGAAAIFTRPDNDRLPPQKEPDTPPFVKNPKSSPDQSFPPVLRPFPYKAPGSSGLSTAAYIALQPLIPKFHASGIGIEQAKEAIKKGVKDAIPTLITINKYGGHAPTPAELRKMLEEFGRYMIENLVTDAAITRDIAGKLIDAMDEWMPTQIP